MRSFVTGSLQLAEGFRAQDLISDDPRGVHCGPVAPGDYPLKGRRWSCQLGQAASLHAPWRPEALRGPAAKARLSFADVSNSFVSWSQSRLGSPFCVWREDRDEGFPAGGGDDIGKARETH